jgi:phosphatidylglycerophosphate synthase
MVSRVLAHLIPNGLSLVRLGLGLAFPWVPADGRVLVVLLAALTDLLDGLSARWLHAQSLAGRLLDPVADKVFVLMLAGTLIAEGTLGAGWAVAVASRDLVVLAGAAYVMARGRWSDYRRMQPTWTGKVATAAQFALLLALVLRVSWSEWLVAPTALLSLAAAVHYGWVFVGWQRGAPAACR